jgi:hypothetical protein
MSYFIPSSQSYTTTTEASSYLVSPPVSTYRQRNFSKSASVAHLSTPYNFSSNLSNLASYAASGVPGTSSSMLNQLLNTYDIGQHSSVQPGYVSEVETAMLQSSNPIEINQSEAEEITVNGQRGIWANKHEAVNWRGLVPLHEYEINEDLNPEVILKSSNHEIEYVQEMAIRYLRPPTPPEPGEIVINQLPNLVTPPAPPIIVRQQPPRPVTPEPCVIREAPPPPPPQIGRKIITISGKRLPPPPRKVIIERLAQLPTKPQAVIVERWLPYTEVKRRVIFNKPTEKDPIVVKPRNVIIQWASPICNIKKEYRYLGVIRANPGIIYRNL